MLKVLQWYWSRLKCMTPTEIGYRFKKAIYIRMQKLGFCMVDDVPFANTRIQANQFINNPGEISIDSYFYAASNIIKGEFPVFALENANLGSPPMWNRDPLSGTHAPNVFGKTLNYRDNNLVGDIKYLWEPNRHLQLVTLAQAFMLSHEEFYLEELRKQLESWFDQCPYMMGPNWTSSLELGIRLINWSLIWQMVGGYDSLMFKGNGGAEFRQRWIKSIYQHAHFISTHQSGYSSANNHLIGEVAGLFVAAVTWPYWTDCKAWHEQAQKILEREALMQNAPDGVNFEQAISYQQFVLDFLIISGLSGRENGLEFSDDYWHRIEQMLEYLASIMDVNGNVPMIGDADDGYVVRLSMENNWCPYRSLLATGAVLFKRGDFKFKAGHLDEKTLWLLGANAGVEYQKIRLDKSTLPIHRAFPDGGYYILGSNFETENEIRLIVDAGPLGYSGIAAHGHADALAFTLSIGGQEFLIDPGTYAYHTQKKWRDYFRGTSAHNTICIDGEDQSVSGGNFMWLRKANATCEAWEPGEDIDHFIGMHDGYTRLSDSVIHRREISLHKLNKSILVTDELTCKGKHTVECYWHFSEDCKVNVNDGLIEVLNAGKKLTMIPSESNGVTKQALLKEDASRPLGWVSRRYDVKIPTQTLVRSIEVNASTTICTEIRYE